VNLSGDFDLPCIDQSKTLQIQQDTLELMNHRDAFVREQPNDPLAVPEDISQGGL
jgi:hypothetical protein